MIEDLADRYHEYLVRFARDVGDVEVGGFRKHAGTLIKKLSFEEFGPALLEYLQMLERYEDGLTRGDTINDIAIKVMRAQAAVLVLAHPGP